MEVLYMFMLVGVVALIMSLFSVKKGSSTLIISILSIFAIIAALYNNPNIETLILIVFVVSMFFFITNRYWRNSEGYDDFAQVRAKIEEARKQI